MMTYPELKIGDLTAKKPIIQGGMGIGISLSGLAGCSGESRRRRCDLDGPDWFSGAGF